MSAAGVDVVRVVAFWRAKPDTRGQVRDILDELAACTRRERGCVSFEVLEAIEEPGRFVLLEEYAGALGRSRHLASEHFGRLVTGAAVPLLTYRRVDVYRAVHCGSGSSCPGPEMGSQTSQPERTIA